MMALPAYTVLTKVSLSCIERLQVRINFNSRQYDPQEGNRTHLDGDDIGDGGNIELGGETGKN